MRRTFKRGDDYAIGQRVEWLNGSRWLAGTITGPREVDVLGFAFYPVENTRATPTVSAREPVRGYAGHVRPAAD